MVFREKDSESSSLFWTVEGNNSHSVQLTDLDKYVLYEIQVLGFTRIGDGAPSLPPILQRTLDDGGRFKTLLFLLLIFTLLFLE